MLIPRGVAPRLTPGKGGGQEQGIYPISPCLSPFHLCAMLTDTTPKLVSASSEELLLIAERLERLVAIKRLVDEEAGEDGAGLVMLSGREIELIAECVRTVGADRWREGR